MSTMNPYSTLSSLKKLVDAYEDAIKEGKLATLTQNPDLVMKFVSTVKNIAAQTSPVLEEAKCFIEKEVQGDDLTSKYISAYYRMLVMVSVPYIVMILRDLMRICTKHGQEDRVNEIKSIVESFEATLGTLKQRSVHP